MIVDRWHVKVSAFETSTQTDQPLDGADVGDRGHEDAGSTALLAFGHRLTCTQLRHSDDHVRQHAAGKVVASVELANTCKRDGSDIMCVGPMAMPPAALRNRGKGR